MRIQDKNIRKSSYNIHACAESGDLKVFKKLLGSNLRLLKETTVLDDDTPLHISAGHNKSKIVKYLLGSRRKVELEVKNINGETPLHLATKNGCSETARLLLDQGADIEAKSNDGKTPLHLAVGYALRSGDNSMVEMLSEYDASFSAKDDDGMIPFDYLPQGLEDSELYRLLYQNNDVQSTDSDDDNDVQSSESDNYNNVRGSESDNNNDEQSSDRDDENDSSNGYQTDEEPKDNEKSIEEKIAEFEEEISKIVGLKKLKEQLRKWAKGMMLDEKRRSMGLNVGPRKSPHMAFLGNPGTGKTSIARILGKLLVSVGVLSSDNVTEVQRSDLVAEYVGQTAVKTKNKIEDAMGGVLFVDEAYRLAPVQGSGDSTDFGVEALEEIMSVLEDGEIVVIFAGYTEPMKRVFSTNAGFCRRVTHFFEFEDFTCQELAEMLMLKMTKQNEKSRLYGFKLHPSCTMAAVLSVIEKNSTEKLRNKMNGGLIDNMLNNARESLDGRLSSESKADELLTIMLQDLEVGLQQLAERVNLA